MTQKTQSQPSVAGEARTMAQAIASPTFATTADADNQAGQAAHTPTPYSISAVSGDQTIMGKRDGIRHIVGVVENDRDRALIVRAVNERAQLVAERDAMAAVIDQVSRYLTGDCRAGDLTNLESIICDVEAIRAKHGLDSPAHP